jgi:hypothetical protein
MVVTQELIAAFQRRFPKQTISMPLSAEELAMVRCIHRGCTSPRVDFSVYCSEHGIAVARTSPGAKRASPSLHLCEHRLDAKYLGVGFLHQHPQWICPECAKEAGIVVACVVCLAPAMVMRSDVHKPDPLPDLQELRTYFCHTHLIERLWPFPNMRIYPRIVDCNECGEFHPEGMQCAPPNQKEAHRAAKRAAVRSCPARDERCVSGGDCVHVSK